MVTKGRQRTNKKFDAKRKNPITGRLNDKEREWLDARRLPGEGWFPALKRLAGVRND